MIPFPKNGDVLVCPVCKKEFKFSNEHRFIFADEYTCSWKCFMAKSEKAVKRYKELWGEDKFNKLVEFMNADNKASGREAASE